MQQMLPVIAGVKFPRPLLNARLIFLLLSTGTLTLVFGLYASDPIWLKIAAGLLGSGIGYFILLAGYALSGVAQRSDSVRAFGYAFWSLGAALFFGLLVVLSHAGVIGYREVFAHLHIAWMVVGWMMLLVIGVSFQVVPMFYVTEAYSLFCRRYGTVLLFGALIVFSLVRLFAPGFEIVAVLLLGFALLIVIGYAAVTIRRLYTRKRATRESNIRLWYLAMGSLIAGIILWSIGYLTDAERLVIGGGMVLAVGFAVSLITAMLYKIVPFLVWFHLSSMGHFDVATMRELVPERRIRLHLWVHCAAYAALVGAVFFSPALFPAAGLLFGLSNILLFINLVRAGLYYRRKKSEPVMGMASNR